jgi:energy-coupling factor transporter ATP-binding protein EcfA2
MMSSRRTSILARIEALVFPSGERILQDVVVDAVSGDRVLIDGGNGYGKSTLLKVLAGIIPTCEDGTIVGEVRRSWITPLSNPDDVEGPLFEQTGFIFQNADDNLASADIHEQLRFSAENFGVPKEIFTRRLASIGPLCGDLVARKTPTYLLSPGEKQRLALAGEILRGTPVLFLDEPTAALDEGGRRFLYALLAGNLPEVDAPPEIVIVASHDREMRQLPIWTKRILLQRDNRPLLSPGRAERATMPAYTNAIPMEMTVEVKNLTMRRPGDGADAFIAKGFNGTFRRGDIVLISGANGSGKTTLLKVLAGLRPSDAGDLLLGGVPIRKLTNPWPSRVLMLTENPKHQLVEPAVEQETGIASEIYNMDHFPVAAATLLARANAIIDLQGHVPIDARNPTSLSAGEQRLLTLAMLEVVPELLVLDEPDRGLDADSLAYLRKLIAYAAGKGAVVIVTTHDSAFIDDIVRTRIVVPGDTAAAADTHAG